MKGLGVGPCSASQFSFLSLRRHHHHLRGAKKRESPAPPFVRPPPSDPRPDPGGGRLKDGWMKRKERYKRKGKRPRDRTQQKEESYLRPSSLFSTDPRPFFTDMAPKKSFPPLINFLVHISSLSAPLTYGGCFCLSA